MKKQKTAPAAKANKKTSKVAKSKSKVVKKKATTTKPKTLLEKYSEQRELFYQQHPMARYLLGLLIISFAISFGVLIHDWKEVYVGVTLDQYGIRYPYVEPLIMVEK